MLLHLLVLFRNRIGFKTYRSVFLFQSRPQCCNIEISFNSILFLLKFYLVIDKIINFPVASLNVSSPA